MARNKMKKVFAWLTILVGLFAGMVFAGFQSVYADSSINDKASASAVIDCYEKGQFKTPVKRSDFYGGISNIMKTGQNVYIPTSVNGNSTMKCDQYVNKLLGNKGVSVPNQTTPSQNVTSFMVGLGYTTTNTGSNGKCVYYKYTDNDNNSTIATQKICASSVDSKTGVILVDNLEIQSGDTSIVQFQGAKNSSITLDCNTDLIGAGGGCGKHTFTKGVTKWDDFVKEIENDLLTHAKTKAFAGGSEGSYVYSLDGIHDETVTNTDSYDSATATYELTVNERALTNGTRYLTGSTYGSKPTFDDGEQFVLYQNYLVDYFGAEIHCDWNETEITAYGSSYKKTRLYQNGEFKTCYVRATKNANKSVGGIDGSRHFGSDCNFDCIVGWLESSTVTSLPSDILEAKEDTKTNSAGGTSGGTDTGGKAEFDCDDLLDAEGGKIGAMQWILCPSLNNTAYTANWIDTLTQDMLEVKTDRYDTNSKTFKAWELVRNVANVLMIVFLMIIIISQLTGKGIDNYGIKKMLPRLITMAIIINLSFYICEIAIDLSNIAGVGLRDMFGSFGTQIDNGANGGTGFVTTSIMGIFTAFSTGSGAGIAAGTAAAGLGLGWVAVVIGAIVLVLVVLVALAVLWLMLGAREIIILFCVMLSPLAFACFILPNTQNLFKKWWELFKAALIIFPICGAMAGISAILKGIGNGEDLGWGGGGQMILMILPYLGFFLLPMLLKNAIAALGKVGGALASLGNTVRNGGRALQQSTSRAVQNSQRFKDWSQFRQEQAAAQRAQRIHDRLSGRTDLTRRQQSQLRSADDILLAQRKKAVENESRASGEYFDAATVKQDLAIADEQRATQLYNDPNYSAMMEQHGETALLNEREKMYSEQFASKDKVVNTANLRNALVGNDAEQAAAAFTTLNSQGISEAMDELYNANWNGMNNNVREKLLARMAASNVDSFKSFAKYRQSGGQKSFKDWVHGAGAAETGVKDASFASHLNDLKEHAMDSYTKDEMEFVNKHAADSLNSQLGSQEFGSMLRSAAISSKEPKMQTQAEDIVRKQIQSGAMSVSDLGFTAENLGSTRADTLKSVRQGYIDKFQSQGYDAVNATAKANEIIRSELKDQIAQARADQRIYNRMGEGTKDILGIGKSSGHTPTFEGGGGI